MYTHRFAHLTDPGDRAPSAPERRRHDALQRDAGPSFLTPRYAALTAADGRGRTLTRLAPPASELVEPTSAYLALLYGHEHTPRVAVAVPEASARPDAPNAPSTALLAAVMREGIAAE